MQALSCQNINDGLYLPLLDHHKLRVCHLIICHCHVGPWCSTNVYWTSEKKLKRELGTTWIFVFMMLTTIIDFIFILQFHSLFYALPTHQAEYWHFNLVSLEWYYYILKIDMINTPVIQRNGDTQLLYRWFVICLMLQHPFQVLIVYLAQKWSQDNNFWKDC